MNKYYDDWLALELDTEVIDCQVDEKGYWIACKESNFYATGGGMEKDTGTINNNCVLDVKNVDGIIYHLVDQPLTGPAHLKIDRKQRIMKCQIHSASHLMCAYINQYYNAKTIAFFYHEELSGIEMALNECNEKTIEHLEKVVNDYILLDLPLEIVYPTMEEALAHVKEEKVDHEDLRAVVIKDLDYNMCGCIHVPSMRYLKMIKYTGYEKTTRGYRIYFVVGEQLSKYVDTQNKQLSSVASKLHVSMHDINEGIERLQAEIKSLSENETKWKQKVIDSIANEITETSDTIVVREIQDLDIKSLQIMVSTLVRNTTKTIGIVDILANSCHVMIVRPKEAGVDCRSIFKELSDEFDLKGGGNDSMAQGGGNYHPNILKRLVELVDFKK